MDVTLTRAVIEQVAAKTGYRYSWDEDGDLRIGMSRRRGKDLIFYISMNAADKGLFKASCYCDRYFSPDEYLSGLVFCNDWNDNRLMPRAIMLKPDRDGDRRIYLNFMVICSRGISIDVLSENFEFFLHTAHDFWEEADRTL